MLQMKLEHTAITNRHMMLPTRLHDHSATRVMQNSVGFHDRNQHVIVYLERGIIHNLVVKTRRKKGGRMKFLRTALS
uniref:Uncharacterized protein n=1 Tax=Romanomermis culicivorax TaxID=13658 RepID=A0A915IDQ0_ROMCU